MHTRAFYFNWKSQFDALKKQYLNFFPNIPKNVMIVLV